MACNWDDNVHCSIAERTKSFAAVTVAPLRNRKCNCDKYWATVRGCKLLRKLILWVIKRAMLARQVLTTYRVYKGEVISRLGKWIVFCTLNLILSLYVRALGNIRVRTIVNIWYDFRNTLYSECLSWIIPENMKIALSVYVSCCCFRPKWFQKWKRKCVIKFLWHKFKMGQ